jgi:pimeloyl-ACP methyl ester carboxylesterase
MSVGIRTGKAVRDGISLAYHEAGSGAGSPILFVHGFGCSGRHFRFQQQYFAASARTIAVDLRGHGASDAPFQDYETSGFADDLRWLCDHLGLERPIVIGHSMGGNIALKLAVQSPGLVKAIAMIDTFVDGDAAFLQGLRELSSNMEATGGSAQLFEILSNMLFLPSDDPWMKKEILQQCSCTPWHVLAAAFAPHLLHGSSGADLQNLAVPAAYIGADGLPTKIWRIEAINSRVHTGKTIGVGHFSPLLAPDQVNAMLGAFINHVNAPLSSTSGGVSVSTDVGHKFSATLL